MIFSVFCWASARWGKRNPVVRPAAAAAPPVILTNFLRLILSMDRFDIGISLLAKIQRWGETTKTEGFYARREGRALRATTSMIGLRRRMHRGASKERSRRREKCETWQPRRPSQER